MKLAQVLTCVLKICIMKFLNMTYKRAKEILIEYNKWRSGDHEPCDFKYSSLELGTAINLAVHALWQADKIQEIVLFGKGGTEYD